MKLFLSAMWLMLIVVKSADKERDRGLAEEGCIWSSNGR